MSECIEGGRAANAECPNKCFRSLGSSLARVARLQSSKDNYRRWLIRVSSLSASTRPGVGLAAMLVWRRRARVWAYCPSKWYEWFSDDLTMRRPRLWRHSLFASDSSRKGLPGFKLQRLVNLCCSRPTQSVLKSVNTVDNLWKSYKMPSIYRHCLHCWLVNWKVLFLKDIGVNCLQLGNVRWSAGKCLLAYMGASLIERQILGTTTRNPLNSKYTSFNDFKKYAVFLILFPFLVCIFLHTDKHDKLNRNTKMWFIRVIL